MRRDARNLRATLLSLCVALAVALVLRVPALAAGPVDDDPNAPANLERITASAEPVRVVVELEDPPLALIDAVAGVPGPARSAESGGTLDFAAASTREHEARLVASQEAFSARLASSVPSAAVEHRYQVVFNGLALRLPGNELPALRRLPGVKSVTVARRHYPQMDASLPLLGLVNGALPGGLDAGLWKQVGGHLRAGAGIKVADIDSGIDQTHPFFSPAGFAYPPGFPKGEAAYTTRKVIAARAYFRPDDPPAAGDGTPRDSDGHGTHTAGAIAGNYGKGTGTFAVRVSGVAPRAWLMNYRIFYQNTTDGGTYSESPEEIRAVEDAVRDGADVINNSWGGTALALADDPTVRAFNAAVSAGVVVVFSAGNSGPYADSIGAPGIGPRFITVGASTTERSFPSQVSVTGPAGFPPALVGLSAVPGTGGAAPADAGPALYGDSLAAGNELGCTAGGGFAAGTFAGKIALIKRGTCTFSEKINNAAAAGAIAVVMFNNLAGAPATMFMPGTTIPAFMVSDLDGAALRSWYDANPGSAALAVDAYYRAVTPGSADRVASFSSRGPAVGLGIKPDLVAPGVNILSSVPGGWALYDGTSMAAPHVSGVAALVRQLHRPWTVAQVKSAVVNTAVLPASLDTSCADASGWAGPQCRGAGRLSARLAGGPGDPGLTLNRVSISLGAQYPGSSFPVPLSVKEVSGRRTSYAVSVEQGQGDAALAVSTSKSAFTVAAGGAANFSVSFAIGDAVPAGDYYGRVLLRSTSGRYNLGVPYWVRVLPAPGLPAADVLLIDDDGSNHTIPGESTLADYRAYYTNALDALGISYAVLEADHATCASPWFAAMKYRQAIHFTGDSLGSFYYCGSVGSSRLSSYGASLYLAGGGRLLATGQDYAWGINVSRSTDLPLYFGANYVQDDVFGAAPPTPSGAAVEASNPFLAGVQVDLAPGHDGAGNQIWSDELATAAYPDVDAVPLLQVDPAVTPVGEGRLGVRLSSEPTIERLRRTPRNLWTALGWRSVLLSFGVEAVNDLTGYTTRGNLLRRLLNWLDDRVTVTKMTVPLAARRGAVVRCAGEAAGSVADLNGISGYRWNFGDGTPTISRGGPATAVSHRFARAGRYTVWLEATDAYGHKAVKTRRITVAP